MKQFLKYWYCTFFISFFILNQAGLYAADPVEAPVSPPVTRTAEPFSMVIAPDGSNKIHSSSEEAVDLSSLRVSLDYTNVNLHDVLKAFAYSYKLNIVLTKDIEGKVSAQLKDQSVDDALDAILAVNNYGFTRKGNIIYVMPKADMEPVIESIPINYLAVDEAKALLGKASSQGEIQPNVATNSLIVRGTPSEIKSIKAVIKEVDVPPIQVLIEAKIVDISRADIQSLGSAINLTYSPFSDHLATASLLTGTAGSGGGDGALSKVTGLWQHISPSLTIDALVKKNKARVLASPSIATLNGREASITIGEKFPYESSSTINGASSQSNISFADIGTKLRVTPTISSEGWITLKVHPEVSSVKQVLSGLPNIATREADTIVRVRDNETVVIGGLISKSDLNDNNGVPGLKDIPVFGKLFQRNSSAINGGELTVFITPHIIPMPKKDTGEKSKDYRGKVSNFSASHDVTALHGLLDYADSLENEKSKDQVDNLYWSEEMIATYRSILQQFPQSGKADFCLYKIILIYAKEFGRCDAAQEALSEMKSVFPQSPYITIAEPLVNACKAVFKNKVEKIIPLK